MPSTQKFAKAVPQIAEEGKAGGAAAEKKSRGMKTGSGTAIQKSDDSPIVIQSGWRCGGTGGRWNGQILKPAFSGLAAATTPDRGLSWLSARNNTCVVSWSI